MSITYIPAGSERFAKVIQYCGRFENRDFNLQIRDELIVAWKIDESDGEINAVPIIAGFNSCTSRIALEHSDGSVTADGREFSSLDYAISEFRAFIDYMEEDQEQEKDHIIF